MSFVKFNFNTLGKNVFLERFLLMLLFFGLILNLLKNRLYDNDWTVGEWLISYPGAFIRRGLIGKLIYIFSKNLQINPIYFIWFICIFSFIGLFLLIKLFSWNIFNKSFLLSNLVLLGPISENYFIRKDVFIVFLYGLCLLTLKKLKEDKINRFTSIVLINLYSLIAILSHEVFFIWAFPSIFLLVIQVNSLQKYKYKSSLIITLLNLLPMVIAFICCIIFNGDSEKSLLIHKDWQNLSNLIPSDILLSQDFPTGAIAAIGWDTKAHFLLSKSTLTKFNLNIFWHPAMWLLTIYFAIRLFLGVEGELLNQKKRLIICFQFLFILPIFLPGADYGRWIFMWITSSVLLIGYLEKVQETDIFLKKINIFKIEKNLKKLLPDIRSYKQYYILILSIGIPHCCWSVGRYVISNPLGFAFKNIIFYFDIAYKSLIN
tara:strand:+ start:865 stop:2157 length:1293 start_codon:yes stop_codon:yes gene_type:complete